MDLGQLKIIVTGGASGIGRATAEKLVRAGASVAIGDVQADRAAAVADGVAGAGGSAFAHQLDVADAASVATFVKTAESVLGGITGLVNVAGVQIGASIAEQSEEDWDRQMAVNVKGPWLMTREVLPTLRRTSGASIVHVASLAAIKGFAGVTGYSASKGAVAAFTRSSAVELAPFDIRVNCVCPGWVDTPFNEPIIAVMGGREAQAEFIARSVPMRRQATPEEIAPTIVHLLSSDSSYTTGQLLTPDGGSAA